MSYSRFYFILCLLFSSTLFAQTGTVLMPLSHREKINKLVVSPDGKFAVSADWNNLILWDVASGFSIASYVYKKTNSSEMAFSPDSKKLAVCSHEKLDIYNTATGKSLASLKVSDIVAAWFLTDDEVLILRKGKIHRVNINNNKVLKTVNASNDYLLDFQFITLSQEKNRLYRFEKDHLSYTDINTGYTVHFSGANNPSSFAEDIHHNRVAVAAGNGTITLFDSSGNVVTQLGEPVFVNRDGFIQEAEKGYGAGSMMFINEEELFTHDADEIKIWNVQTGIAEAMQLSSNYFKEHLVVNDSILALFGGDSILLFNYRQKQVASINTMPVYGRTSNIVGEFQREFSFSQAANLLLVRDTSELVPVLVNLRNYTVKKKLDTKGIPDMQEALLTEKNGVLQLFTAYENYCVGWDLRNARTFFQKQHSIRFGEYASKSALGSKVDLSPSGKWLALSFNDYFNVFNFNVVNTCEFYSTKDYSLRYSLDLIERFNIAANDVVMYQRFSEPLLEIGLLNLASGTKTVISYDSVRAGVAKISPSGKYVAFMKGKQFFIYHVKQKKLVKGGVFQNWREDLSDIIFSANEQMVSVLGFEAVEIPVFSTATGKRIRSLAPPPPDDNRIMSWAAFAPGDKQLLAVMSGTLYSFNLFDTLHKQWETDFIPVSEKISDSAWAFNNTRDTLFRVVPDEKLGFKAVRRIPMPGTGFSMYGSNMVVTNPKGVTWYRITNADTLQFIAEVYSTAPEQGMFLVTPWYTATKEAAQQLHFLRNNSILSFDQLDIEYNRPDQVLAVAGSVDTGLIYSYRKAWYKRLKKLGIDTSMFHSNYSVPVADFANRSSVSYEQHSSTLTLDIHASDSAMDIARFNIWVNDVPVYGMKGVPVTRGRLFDTTLSIVLSNGDNRIETSVVNSAGIESLRVPLYVKNSLPPQKEQVYFIGLAIDHYRDSTYDLKWSVKDIRDLAASFKSRYPGVIIDTLFNSRLTRENIVKLKPRLRGLGVEDKIIVAYSGHGLLDKELDYYLSTYDVNFTDPSQSGLAYETLELLLDSIAPRQKLLLIDACHSGEVDKEEVARVVAVSGSLDSLGTTVRSTIKVKPKTKLGMVSSFELMQNVFANVSRGTGTTIISAAGGMQYAQERGDLKNGVFTFSVLEAFRNNKNVTVSQLKKMVGERVVELTRGLQKPTSRNETTYHDWRVW